MTEILNVLLRPLNKGKCRKASFQGQNKMMESKNRANSMFIAFPNETAFIPA